jgi:GT2 family glycosyltransferase
MNGMSIIIPTYQRCASVLRALRALGQQTLSPDAYEVIVCIDGSEDGTREALSRFSTAYKLGVIWQNRRGRAAACNAGVYAATGELLVFLDDDMEPAPGFLTAHQKAHGPRDKLGIVGAVPITFEESSPPVVRYIGLKFNQHLETLCQPHYKFKLRDFYSGNFSISREILLRVGPFDEDFKAYGNEDLELSVRLSKAGVQLRFCPDALARQYYNKDFPALARDNIAKGRTAVLLAAKHPQTFADLKLSTYHQGSHRWRLLRAALLKADKVWGRTPDAVIFFVMCLERLRPARLHTYYNLALDYFYWVGATRTLGERNLSEHSTIRLTQS